MIVGLGGSIVLCDQREPQLFEWTCEEGQDGELIGVHVSCIAFAAFWVFEFGLRRAGENHGVEQLVASKVVGAGATTHRVTCKKCQVLQPPAPKCSNCAAPLPDVWVGGVDGASFQVLAREHPIDWDVEVGDTVFVRVMNMSANNQTFSLGLRISDRGVSKEKFWWANEATGKLERPMTFGERKLKPGARRAGLIVVDPETYEGFDGTHEGQAS